MRRNGLNVGQASARPSRSDALRANGIYRFNGLRKGSQLPTSGVDFIVLQGTDNDRMARARAAGWRRNEP